MALGAAWLALASSAGAATSIDATVVRVIDGDTLVLQPLTSGAAPLRLRLSGLDAPERCQSGGPQASEALSQRVLKQRVRVVTVATDDYQRSVGTLSLNGEDVGAWLVLQGHAWTRGARHAPAPYAQQELDARTARRGIFADPAAQDPRSFRRQHGPCE